LKFDFHQIIQTNLDGEITKTKIVDLDEIYNFVSGIFFIWNHLWSQNSVWSSYIVKFNFLTIQINSDEEATNTKFVDHEEIYNLFDDCFIW
jgi:hypothetical protein